MAALFYGIICIFSKGVVILVMNRQLALAFLAERYGLQNGEINNHKINKMRLLFDLYQKYSKEWDISKASLLEIGGGPSLLNSIVAAPYFNKIVFSEYDSGLREKVTEWKEKHSDMFDWSPYFSFVYGDLMGMNPADVVRQQEVLRGKLAHVIHGNYLEDGVIDSAYVPEEKFQMVVAIYCLSIDHDIGDNLTMRLKRISPLLKENGFILAIICGEGNFYKLLPTLEEKVKLFNLSRDDISSAFQAAGFVLKEHEVFTESVAIRNDVQFGNCVLACKSHIN